jgi:hypothetical protein
MELVTLIAAICLITILTANSIKISRNKAKVAQAVQSMDCSKIESKMLENEEYRTLFEQLVEQDLVEIATSHEFRDYIYGDGELPDTRTVPRPNYFSLLEYNTSNTSKFTEVFLSTFVDLYPELDKLCYNNEQYGYDVFINRYKGYMRIMVAERVNELIKDKSNLAVILIRRFKTSLDLSTKDYMNFIFENQKKLEQLYASTARRQEPLTELRDWAALAELEQDAKRQEASLIKNGNRYAVPLARVLSALIEIVTLYPEEYSNLNKKPYAITKEDFELIGHYGGFVRNSNFYFSIRSVLDWEGMTRILGKKNFKKAVDK